MESAKLQTDFKQKLSISNAPKQNSTESFMKLGPSTNQKQNSLMQKCERFAVEHRRSKKKEMLARRRETLKWWKHTTQEDLNQVSDIHPVFQSPYTTAEDKMLLALQILTEEISSSIDQNITTPRLLKTLIFVDKILGLSTSQSGAVPSSLLIEKGLVQQILKLLFSKKHQRNHQQITPRALLVLSRMACTHSSQCMDVFRSMTFMDYQQELLVALVDLATKDYYNMQQQAAGQTQLTAQEISVCRKTFRVIYNLVIDDRQAYRQLLEMCDHKLVQVFRIIFQSSWEKSFSNDLFQSLVDFLQVLSQVPRVQIFEDCQTAQSLLNLCFVEEQGAFEVVHMAVQQQMNNESVSEEERQVYFKALETRYDMSMFLQHSTTTSEENCQLTTDSQMTD